MTTLVDVVDEMRANRAAALSAVGEAWATAIAAEAPQGLTGRLKASARWVPESDTRGHVELIGYGEIVDAGLPGATVVGAAGNTIALAPLSVLPRAIARRAAYARKVGHEVVHPNPFVERAWQSNAVQDALRQLPDLLFSRG